MGVLRAVVEVSALSVLDIGQQMALSYPIASKLVGDDHPRHILQTLQQTPEELLGGFRIPSVLHKDIEGHAILIHGTPQAVLNLLDPDEHLIEVPFVSSPGPAAETMSKTRAKFSAPAPHRLVGDVDAAFGQKQLHVAQTEAEHVVWSIRRG
jgi:hypothetical protein